MLFFYQIKPIESPVTQEHRYQLLKHDDKEATQCQNKNIKCNFMSELSEYMFFLTNNMVKFIHENLPGYVIDSKTD